VIGVVSKRRCLACAASVGAEGAPTARSAPKNAPSAFQACLSTRGALARAGKRGRPSRGLS